MLQRLALTLTVLALTVAAGSNLQAQERPEFRISRTSTPPTIDGDLGDEVWSVAPLQLSEWVSYNPLRGDEALERTDVRIVYDDRYIYFAFHCFDREPQNIRTTLSRRDSVFSDDWIALSLDSAGTGQTAYHLFVNPSGIQMDALNSSASGEQFDADMIWDSSGKVTDDGYVVEIRLPLQTIRFSGGDEVKMGLLFFRKVSRIGVSYSWPEMPPGQWVFDRHARVVFQSLNPPRLIELLPSTTYSISQLRATADRWNDTVGNPSAGISAKYGLTSNITLDATINPDFSQVESDAFQVVVNQRFPVFFSEKRPFFMEGMGLFNIAGTGGDANMRTAVHTRVIRNPDWGSKLTGTVGQLTFGVLNSSDASPADVGNRGEPIAGRGKLFTIARATYALGESNYIGGILTDTEHAGRYNRVVGGDLSLKLSPPQQLSATFLASFTGLASSPSDTSDAAAQASYSYNTRRFSWSNQIEHYGRDFQMDTAFYNRTGFTSGWSFGEVNFYPRGGKNFWVQRVHPFYFTKLGYDRVQDGSESFLNAGIRFNFTRQGFLGISHTRGREPWLGQEFEVGGGMNVNANGQVLRWLNVRGNFNYGRQIYYDPVNPFQGDSRRASVGVTLQPNQHLNQSIDYNGVRFDRASTGARVYSVDILNTKTTYQFNKHFLIRLLEQFDSSTRRLLTDLLASYEFVPGSVLHAGYGSLYEEPGVNPDGSPGDLGNKYLTVSRGLFFKASYLHRF